MKIFLVAGVLALLGHVTSERTFTVDHENDTFLMDGKPFQYVAGSFHYFRSVPETWQRKLRLMKAAGLNAVDIYIHWGLHNPRDDVYNFMHLADIDRFMDLATEEGLYIILRPGPYICAETEFGGLPYWLVNKYPNIKVRTSDADYVREVNKWWSVLMPRFEKHWYGNGGNVIMVQVENEYGSLGVCDKVYLNDLRDETEKYVKGRALLFTVDMPYGGALECGFIENVFATVDFGINSTAHVDKHFNRMRDVQPTGPLVNSEYYSGWYTHWHMKNQQRNSGYDLAATLRYMLDLKANVNFYMFFGGTNFGFWSGANNMGYNYYAMHLTSYDYDAPLDEAGDTTIKYDLIQSAISKYFPIPSVAVFEPIPKVVLPDIKMTPIDTVLSDNSRKFLASESRESSKLLSFEELNQFSGYVLYETNLPKFTRDPSILKITGLRDRAQILIDGHLKGVLSRESDIDSLPLTAGIGQKLQILVENQGRINFEVMDDYKGIFGNVTLQQYDFPYYQVLTDWTITGYPFENMDNMYRMIETNSAEYTQAGRAIVNGPVVYHGEVELTESQLGDTWWDTNGWGKGFVILNGFNLGRHWPVAGPQYTIFIPKDLLKVGQNKFTIVEQQLAPQDNIMQFRSAPIFT